LGTLFTNVKFLYVLILTKIFPLDDFFTNSSGHPMYTLVTPNTGKYIPN
jgi:hypothetical protein